MAFGDEAYYDGENRPRCKKAPTRADKDTRPALTRGTWVCALPAGHEGYDKPRHQPHSWAQVEEG